MSDYVKITDYAAKDALLSGNPAKLVKGTEIGADFDAVAAAVATKADENGATLTNVTISSGTAALTTLDATNVEVTNIKAKDGTAAMTIADSTGAVTISSPVLGTLSGILKAATGVVSAATASTDYLVPSDITNMLETADIGVSVQGYDADTAKLDVDQTWTGAQRGTATTDNDGSFDQNESNNFICTPTGNVTLTFTNHTSGQSGFVLFVNTGGYTGHAVASSTKVDSSFLSTINATGTYLISYFDNGTNAYCVTSKVLA